MTKQRHIGKDGHIEGRREGGNERAVEVYKHVYAWREREMEKEIAAERGV